MHTLRLLFAFSILLGNHGWRPPLRHRRTGRLHRQSALPDDDDVPPSPSTVRLTAGQETLVSTLAENRRLSTVELEVTFSHLPALKALAQADASWPPLTPRAAVQRALAAVEAMPTEEDVVKVLEIFRKTILGKEKYRIVNPGKVAATYNEVLRTCLAVPECFGAAANALDYAGLVLREHVIERPRTTDGGGGAVLDVASLWTTACVRLLDVDVGVGSPSSDDTPEGTKTWDQRFFSQVDMDLDGQASIQDMMLNVLRVAVRVLLAREADLAGPPTPGATGPMGTVDVAVDEYGGGGGAYFPPVSAAKLVLALECRLLQEIGLDDGDGFGGDEEEEGSDEALIAYLTAKDEDEGEGGGRAWDEVTLLRVCDRRCTAYPQRPGTDIFQAFAPPPPEEED